MKANKSGDRVFNLINYSLLVILGVVTVYPFLNVLALSLNDSIDSVRGGITIWPRMFTLNNFKEVFSYSTLLHASLISLLRTIIGTVAGIGCTAMLAFTLSREDYFARKFVSMLFIITMYVGGGMIPVYMNIRMLGLMKNFLVYIIPGLISVFNVIVLRSYIDGLPLELQDAAMLDGASDFKIFYKVIFPLCTPVIATLSLFVAVDQWNSWFDTYLYCSSDPNLSTLQFELQKILSNAQVYSRDMNRGLEAKRQASISPESIRMAMTVATTLPILFVYPFAQKYFVKGMVLGAVKS